jgi:NADH dehydrogenase
VVGEVTEVDLEARTVSSTVLDRTIVTPYDSLIVAAGARTSYFGNERFATEAPGLKTVADALELRRRIFGAFEMAEVEPDPGRRAPWLTFVVVGGGPTGVEMAGQIAELAGATLRSNFRHFDPVTTRVVLVDALPAVLSGFDGRVAHKAADRLRQMGVELRLGARVTQVDADGIEAVVEGAAPWRIEARTKVWAAGVRASALGEQLARAAGLELAPDGRVPVLADCSLPGYPEVFVVGDMMALGGLPGVAEVALQSGRHAAAQIERRLSGGGSTAPFRYRDLGTLASISRFYAVAQIGPLRAAGLGGWVLWLGVHLAFLTGFKNRVTTVLHWLITFSSAERSERAITLGRLDGAGPGGSRWRDRPAGPERRPIGGSPREPRDDLGMGDRVGEVW